MVTKAQGATDSRDYFFSLSHAIGELLQGEEIFTCQMRAEDSKFARLNHARIGQAGDVRQRQIDLDLISGRRHARGALTVCGERAADWPRVRQLVADLRAIADAAPEDPFLAYNTDLSTSSEDVGTASLPAVEEVFGAIERGTGGGDLVGIYAAGRMYRGFASSLGQRNWHSSGSFNFDWSLFDLAGRAVKGAYAEVEWKPQTLVAKLDASRVDLSVLARPARVLEPGRYRVYLAPAAMHELMSILAWGGFSLRDRRTKVSPFLRLHEGADSLSPMVSLSEDIGGGTAPAFEAAGFPRPAQIPLVTAGRVDSCLVSPRSAVEYGVDTNGADEGESPISLDMAGGDLDIEQIAKEVHTGLIVSNLWYLNFSDRPACRTTGMTRYATLWVENGEVQGPVDAMRFDDSVYRILGCNLVGLTRQRDWIMDSDTYEWRSQRTARLPGALVNDFALTL